VRGLPRFESLLTSNLLFQFPQQRTDWSVPFLPHLLRASNFSPGGVTAPSPLLPEENSDLPLLPPPPPDTRWGFPPSLPFARIRRLKIPPPPLPFVKTPRRNTSFYFSLVMFEENRVFFFPLGPQESLPLGAGRVTPPGGRKNPPPFFLGSRNFPFFSENFFAIAYPPPFLVRQVLFFTPFRFRKN